MSPTVGCFTLLGSALLGNCDPDHPTDRQGATEPIGNIINLELKSRAFANGQPIPPQFTCDGSNQPTPLYWTKTAPGTRSYALVVEDPDAASGTFGHWGVFDIPPFARSLAKVPPSGNEVENDFGKLGFSGPCPPKGDAPHHYHFKLFALSVDRLALGRGARVRDVEAAALSHAVGQGELIGIYQRS